MKRTPWLSFAVASLVLACGSGTVEMNETTVERYGEGVTSSTAGGDEGATHLGLTATSTAVGDATVRSGSYANSNYGSSTSVVVDGDASGTVREAFFKFNLASFPAGTTQVLLSVYATESGAPGTLYRTSDFNESTLTWNTRPVRGAAITSRGVTSGGRRITFDVTSVVKAAGAYAFVFSSTNSDGITFSSREASSKPQLQLTYSSTTTPPPTTPPPADSCTGVGTTMECETFALINQNRASAGLAPMTFNAKLRNASIAHNNVMVSQNCFAHVCPGEAGVGTRITNAGYSWSGYGETIAAGYKTASAVVTGWMNSPGHRAILMGSYREVGLAVTPCTSGCTYSPYWTADFANPR